MTVLPVEVRIKRYEETRHVQALKSLGAGTQGTVFMFDNLSRSASVAVKFHQRTVAYEREIAVFHRLADLEINSVCGHHVPMLIGYDDELLAIEMSIVSPPFCLDFGGAYLDRPPDYTPEVWRDWREQKSEDFGEHWDAVEQILEEFKSFGIYIADVNPGNIRFAD